VDATNHAGEYVWPGSVAENGERAGAGGGAGDSMDSVVYVGKIIQCKRSDRESQKLMRSGLYRMVRHPSYLGLLMVFVAIGIHSRNWISFVAAIVPTTAALIYRIHVEEIALRDAFGNEYVEYGRTTKRLVPGVY